MSDFIKGKQYTPDEISAMYGPNWLSEQYKQNTFIPPQKPLIYMFSGFNNDIKDLYKKIYQAVLSVNPDNSFNVYAVGDIVNGTWISKQEAEQYSIQYNKIINPTPYEYWTDAIHYPDRYLLDAISSTVTIRFNPVANTHKVIIPYEN